MAKLQLSLLGPFQVALDGNPVTGFVSNKVRALLAYLAVEANRPHSRESLCGLLWPDWPQSSALSSLRNCLADLRKNIRDQAAEPPFLLITREQIQFNRSSDYRLDLDEFEALSQGDDRSPAPIDELKKAISLYQGSFLEGFSLPDSNPFEEWLEAEREQAKRQMQSALQRLAGAYEQQDEYEQALVYAHRQLAMEPWLEEAHQRVMRLLARSGQRSAALAQYEACQRLLEKELGVKPSDETRRLYETIRDQELSQPAPEAGQQTLHNLPSRLTSFVGREAEIMQLRDWVMDYRLVTLTGPGGVGKTSLALQLAEALRESGVFPGGVWFVDLAPLSDAGMIFDQLMSALNLKGRRELATQDTVTVYLKNRTALLLLDNCEHLVEGCARVAGQLMRVCPQLRLLATSREALCLPGERLYPVQPLNFPDPGRLPSFHVLQEMEAVSLFCDRAQAVLHSFHLDESNAEAVAHICQRLDGIPLALELAAARANLLSAQELADHLDRALILLDSGVRTDLFRHQTLRAMIEWSYNLLSEKERILLRRLAVFVGGWTLEAAEEVVTGDMGKGIHPSEVLGLLGSLVNKSMVSTDMQPGQETRYHLLETTRQFACQELDKSGEAERIATRHSNYYYRLVEQSIPHFKNAGFLAHWRKNRREQYNIRAAVLHSFARPDEFEGNDRLAILLHYYSFTPLPDHVAAYRQGLALCESAHQDQSCLYAFLQCDPGINVDEASPFLLHDRLSRARLICQAKGEKADFVFAWELVWQMCDFERIEPSVLSYMEDLRRIFPRLSPEGKLSLLDNILGHVVFSLARWFCFYENAGALLSLCESWIRDLSSEGTALTWEAARAALDRAQIERQRGQLGNAAQSARESCRLYESSGDRWSCGQPLYILGEIALDQEDYAGAYDFCLKTLALDQEAGEEAQGNLGLAEAELGMGRIEQALHTWREAASGAIVHPHPILTGLALRTLAKIEATRSRGEGKDEHARRAARVLGAATKVRDLFGTEPDCYRVNLDQLLPGWQDRPDAPVISQAWDEGCAMSLVEAAAYGKSVSEME